MNHTILTEVDRMIISHIYAEIKLSYANICVNSAEIRKNIRLDSIHSCIFHRFGRVFRSMRGHSRTLRLLLSKIRQQRNLQFSL